MIFTSYPKPSFVESKKEILQKINNIIDNGNYINSKEVKIFEKNFAKKIGIKYSASVGNATDALFLSLKSIEIGNGDEVITVSHTATATLTAIMRTGAKPQLVDIDEENFNILIKLKKITTKTKAIIVVHLYGQSCDMNKILSLSKKYKLPIIEDCSQAAGSSFKNKKLGSMGKIGCFSFFPTKNLSSIGDGGCIVSSNKKIINKIKSLREYGWDKFRNSKFIGINSRLDEIHAGILNIKLQKLDQDNMYRRKIANRYNKKIINKKFILPTESKGSYHIYHHYVVRTKFRDSFIKYMRKHNVYLGIHYKLPVHKQDILKKRKLSIKTTEKISKEIVSLPIFVGLSTKDQNKIIKLINNFK